MTKLNKFLALELFFYKFRAPFECRNYQIRIFFNQFVFMFNNFTKYKNMQSKSDHIVLFDTNLGKFYIRDTVLDFEFASPAFERQDINELIKRIQRSLDNGKEVVFIDIGADFGTYTVKIGNYFKREREKVRIFSFDPDSTCFQLLKKNVKLNKLKNIKLYKIALSDSSKVKKFFYHTPMQMIVSFKTNKTIELKTQKLDKYLKNVQVSKNTDLYMKLDIEGHEPEALRGAMKTMGRFSNVILLVEDVTDPRVVVFLKKIAKPLIKRSNQNSFWKVN